MEIHTDTAVKASSSSSMQMQLKEQEEQMNFIQRKTDKLSITDNPYQEIETHKQFINKAKQEFNHFTQLIREETQLEVKFDDLIEKSIQTVRRLIMSDEYLSLHDDLKALQNEQYNWRMHELDDHFGISSESDSDSDSEDKGMMLD